MTRMLALPSLLVALIVGGYLYSKSLQTNGPASPQVSQAINQANAMQAASDFHGADLALQAWYTENTTYAGAALPRGSGVVLVRADATSYCLQAAAADGTAEHESGPAGGALPGPC
jgi:hypothetical protein